MAGARPAVLAIVSVGTLIPGSTNPSYLAAHPVRSSQVCPEEFYLGGQADRYCTIKCKVVEDGPRYEIGNHVEQNGITVACGRKCVTCYHVNTRDSIPITTTRQKMTVLNNTSKIWNCESKNVVYLISCRKCGIQYVGETKRKLAERFREHRRAVINGRSNIRIYQHFIENNHSVDDMSVEILQQFTQHDNIRLKAETFWIKQVNSLYPFGLNTKMTGIGNLISTEDVMNIVPKKCPYYKGLKLKRRRCINFSKKHKNTCKTDTQKNTTHLQHFIEQCKNENMGNIYIKMNSTKRTMLQWIIDQCIHNATSVEICAILCAFMMAKESDKQKQQVTSIKTKRVSVTHVHQIVSKLGIPRLISTSSISKYLGRNIACQWHPQVLYKTTEPAWIKICNYTKFLKQLDKEQTHAILKNECHCDQNYRNTDLKHVITGDLSIIKNMRIRKFMELGTKYKSNSCHEPQEILNSIQHDVTVYMDTLKSSGIIDENDKNKVIKQISKLLTFR
ncbi:MAG: GIY-YIG nuclease family protein, partial [Gammaproteobacteria bacterium]|nr:GIY-YIG nuclease family protein [Gammaproteobacteria bacterium]